MDWNPMLYGQMPKAGVEVLLRSKKEQYYIGTYYPEAGIFRVIFQYKLQEDGSILGLTTGFHESNFTHWTEITLPAAETADQTSCEKSTPSALSSDFPLTAIWNVYRSSDAYKYNVDTNSGRDEEHLLFMAFRAGCESMKAIKMLVVDFDQSQEYKALYNETLILLNDTAKLLNSANYKLLQIKDILDS